MKLPPSWFLLARSHCLGLLVIDIPSVTEGVGRVTALLPQYQPPFPPHACNSALAAHGIWVPAEGLEYIAKGRYVGGISIWTGKDTIHAGWRHSCVLWGHQRFLLVFHKQTHSAHLLFRVNFGSMKLWFVLEPYEKQLYVVYLRKGHFWQPQSSQSDSEDY